MPYMGLCSGCDLNRDSLACNAEKGERKEKEKRRTEGKDQVIYSRVVVMIFLKQHA